MFIDCHNTYSVLTRIFNFTQLQLPKSNAIYGPYTDRRVPLRSVRTVRIVKLYEPQSQIRCGNILSPHNEMQFTDRKVPLRSVRTVRIVKLYEPQSQIRCGNTLSPHNEMQFTDCIWTEEYLYDLYEPYGSSNCMSPSPR